MIYIKEAQDPRASLWDFTPVGRVVTDTCDEDEWDELEDSIYAPLRQAHWGGDAYWDAVAKLTDEEKQALKEISLRKMVMSCLVYNSDIRTSTSMNGASKYYGKPYAQEYYDLLGKDVADEIIDQQTEYFNKGQVISDVWTDGEGVTYNSFQKPENG